MEFKRTEETISRLTGKEDLSVRDIMGLIVNDICSDLSENGRELSGLPLGDPEDAIPWICRLARLVARIYKKNQTYFESEEYKDLWDAAGGKMEEAAGHLNALEEQMQQQKAAIQESRIREEELLKELEQLKEEQQKGSEELIRLQAQEELLRQQAESGQKELQVMKERVQEQESIQESLAKTREELKQPYEALKSNHAVLNRLFTAMEEDVRLTDGWYAEPEEIRRLCGSYRDKLRQASAITREYEQLLEYLEGNT